MERAVSSGIASPASGYGPTWERISDYMIGDVVVGVVLPESTGASSTEDWSTNAKTFVRDEIIEGLEWWETEAHNRGIELEFIVADTVVVNTSYEPINEIGMEDPHGDAHLWINDVMGNLGYTQANYIDRVLAYANDLRQTYSTDWAFVVFMVNAENDVDGMFAPGSWGIPNAVVTAWASRPGPHFVANSKSGIGLGAAKEQLNEVVDHEIGHVFGAADEAWSDTGGDCFPGSTCTARFGYLGIQNQNCDVPCSIDVDCVMRSGSPFLVCPYSAGQVGWWDSDDPGVGPGSPLYGDGVPDTIDTVPSITLDAYTPDPPSDRTPTYTGIALDIPYPHQTSLYVDVTINDVEVEYRINGGSWQRALPADGAFDSPYEAFTFAPLLCENTQYTVETRARNEVGNVSSIASDTITVSSSLACLQVYLPAVLKSYSPLLLSAPVNPKKPFISPLPIPALPNP